jgi:hypothetical protein
MSDMEENEECALIDNRIRHENRGTEKAYVAAKDGNRTKSVVARLGCNSCAGLILDGLWLLGIVKSKRRRNLERSVSRKP